uniref:Uncharacterized protein n=1 Tax=Arundo donax TaxID=35708 RepID=A0A0A9FD12_ARUDO
MCMSSLNQMCRSSKCAFVLEISSYWWCKCAFVLN